MIFKVRPGKPGRFSLGLQLIRSEFFGSFFSASSPENNPLDLEIGNLGIIPIPFRNRRFHGNGETA